MGGDSRKNQKSTVQSELDFLKPLKSAKNGLKVPVFRKKRKRREAQIEKSKELVSVSFQLLEEEYGRRPKRVEVSRHCGLSPKKVGEYYKILDL